MAALTLNGITVPVAPASWERPAPTVLGGRGRGTSGRSESAIRKRKVVRRGRTAPLAKAEAEALVHLLEGEGHNFGYDPGSVSPNLYCACGLAPSVSDGCSVVASGKHSTQLRIAAGYKIEYAIPGDAAAWTLAYWKQTLDIYGPVWEHFIRLGSGLSYKNGVPTPHTTINTWSSYDGSALDLYSPAHSDVYTDWVGVHDYELGDLIRGGSASDIYIAGNSGASDSFEPDFDSASNLEDLVTDNDIEWINAGDGWGHFDDVLFLPYVVPASWVAQLYAEAGARAWSPLPFLRAAGDLVTTAATVSARLVGVDPVAHKASGAFERGGVVLSFELLERG